MIGLLIAIWANVQGYESGQIAVLTGNIDVELTVHSDSTSTWEWIEE